MAVIIEGTRPLFRVAEDKSGSGEPRDAISTKVFRTSPQVFQCSESDYPALSAHRVQGEKGATGWAQRSPIGAPVVEIERRKNRASAAHLFSLRMRSLSPLRRGTVSAG